MEGPGKIKHSRPVPPFLRWCSATIPAAFDDSLTYYEALCSLWKWLQTNLVQVVNNNATVTQEYIRMVDELKEFVEDYFKNLDVQKEINNKLDEMAESGALTEIIAQFLGLGALVSFDTLDDMINAGNLIKGAKAKTFGKYEIGDGFGAYYAIDETGDIELSNGLFATIIENFGGNNYIDEITVEKIRRYNTDCYITTIPKTDTNGNLIQPHVAKHPTKTPLEYAQDEKTTLTINAGLTMKLTPDSEYQIGIMIGDGEILSDYEGYVGSALNSMYKYVGFLPDRTYKEYTVNNTQAETMIADGCTNVFNVFYKLVEHGVASDISGVDSVVTNVASTPAPRQCLGVKADGTIIILTCDGRDGNDFGLTSAQTQAILIEFGCYDAWNFDGGGSTSTSHCGCKVNRNIDDNATAERQIEYSLNFKNETIDEELAKVNSRIGQEKQDTLAQVFDSVVQNSSYDISGEDVNNYTNAAGFYFGNNLDNAPTEQGYLLNIPHSQPNQIGKYCKQIFFDRERNAIFARTKQNNAFGSWALLSKCIAKSYVNDYTITTSATYEPLSLNNFTLVTNSLIKHNNDGTVSFDDSLDNSFIRFSIEGNLSDTTTTGNRYVAIMKDGTNDTNNVMKFGKPIENQSAAFNASFVLRVSAASHYTFGVYGAQGNKFERIQVVVETL